MSFQIALDPFEKAYARFIGNVRESIQATYSEASREGLTQREIADTLGVDEALISRRLHGPGNITLRTLCDLFTAMGRDPLTHFVAPDCLVPSVLAETNMPLPSSPKALPSANAHPVISRLINSPTSPQVDLSILSFNAVAA
jgi:transcriptional regulator with XRE-family HTH domain